MLDAFLGSGTTLIAAERTGRRCYGLELDPVYVDTIIRRWQKLSGGSAVHGISGPFGSARSDANAMLQSRGRLLSAPMRAGTRGASSSLSPRSCR
jgi:hypothetical protein